MPILSSGANITLSVSSGQILTVQASDGSIFDFENPVGTRQGEYGCDTVFGPFASGGSVKLSSVTGPVYYELAAKPVGSSVPFDPSNVNIVGGSIGGVKILSTGDGVGDDTARFVAARDAAGVGGKVIVGPGTYLLNNLALSVASQTWDFDKNAAVYTPNSQTTPAITISGDSVTLNGGFFDNRALSTDAFQQVGCVKVLANGVTVTNGRYRRAVGSCLDCQGSNRLTVRGNTFEDTWYTGVFVIPLNADITDIAIENNRVINTTAFAGYKYGINVHNDAGSLYKISNVKVANNEVVFPVITTGTYPLPIEIYGGPGGSAGSINNITVTGNVVVGGSIGISMAQVNDGAMSGNSVSQAYQIGLEAVSPTNIAINGNTVVGPVQSGVSVSQAGTGLSVSGNAIRKTSTNGIVIASVGNNFAVSGNMVNATGGYAINIQSSKRWAVTGNVLEGNSTAAKGVILDKSDQGSVTGNVMQNFTQNGVLLFADAAGTYDRVTVNANVFSATPNTLTLPTQLSGGAVIGKLVSYVRNFSDVDTFYQRDVYDVLNNRGDFSGAGTPEANITAGVGSTYHRTDGAAATCLYVKESGVAATGWIAK